MRGQFVRTLTELAAEDPRTMLLTADLGFGALEPFATRFPDRFINVGVSEQNMIGLATGLADAGYRPYCYSIVPFAALRPLEFIRNGPVLHNLPVRIVGVGGGFEYGHAGPSHHGVDDIGCLRTIGGLSIVSPADAAQTETVLRVIHELPGPAYLRIGKDDRRTVPGLVGAFELGRTQLVRRGPEALLVGMGSICDEVVRAADILAEGGVEVSVAVLASVRPAPVDDLVTLLSSHPIVATVEAHSVDGGLGSLVGEVIAESGARCQLTRIGMRDRFAPGGTTGSENRLNRVHGLDAQSIAETVRSELAARPAAGRRPANRGIVRHVRRPAPHV